MFIKIHCTSDNLEISAAVQYCMSACHNIRLICLLNSTLCFQLSTLLIFETRTRVASAITKLRYRKTASVYSALLIILFYILVTTHILFVNITFYLHHPFTSNVAYYLMISHMFS